MTEFEFSISTIDFTDEGDQFEVVKKHIGTWETFGVFIATLLEEGHTICAPDDDDVWYFELNEN